MGAAIHNTQTINGTIYREEERLSPVRIVVSGLYRSGSTAIAGILHRLGVDMGAPFHANFYEPYTLSGQLRYWWQEPFIIERVASGERIRILKEWITYREKANVKAIGAKHPLLSLCCDDILAAWGCNTRFIWAYRPIEESIASLTKVGWWHPMECWRIQEILWEEANIFFSNNQHFRMEHDALIQDPFQHIERIAKFVGISAKEGNIRAAAAFILLHNKKLNRS